MALHSSLHKLLILNGVCSGATLVGSNPTLFNIPFANPSSGLSFLLFVATAASFMLFSGCFFSSCLVEDT